MKLVLMPDPVLTTPCQPVTDDMLPQVREWTKQMFHIIEQPETLGIGLAANQVGLPWRFFVSYVYGRRIIAINPYLSKLGREYGHTEGCLSEPGIRVSVLRHSNVLMTCQRLDGHTVHLKASGLEAACWQHECDHLDGKPLSTVGKVLPPTRGLGLVGFATIAAALGARP